MSLRRAVPKHHHHSPDCQHSHEPVGTATEEPDDSTTTDDADDTNTTIADPTVANGGGSESVVTSTGSSSDESTNEHNGCLSRLAKSAEQTMTLSHDEYRAKTVNPNATYSGWTAVFGRLFIGRFVLVLHAINAIPEPYQFNPFIQTGYRVSLRKRDCIRSIYRGIHNETGNIYTHLLGSLFFVYLLFSSYSWLANVSIIHYGIFALYLLSALQCLLCSTVYHMFGCHCVCTFEKLLSLDYSGISFLICGSQVPIIFYLFWDDLPVMTYHMTGLFALSLSAHVLTHAQRFQAESYSWLRILAFCSNALYATPVLVYVIWQRMNALSGDLSSLESVSVWSILSNPAVNDAQTQALFDCLYYVRFMYLFYGTGIVFYSSKFPERISPGRFDYWMHSHQIWHMFVVAAAVSQFYACVAIFMYRANDIPLIDPTAPSPFLNLTFL